MSTVPWISSLVRLNNAVCAQGQAEDWASPEAGRGQQGLQHGSLGLAAWLLCAQLPHQGLTCSKPQACPQENKGLEVVSAHLSNPDLLETSEGRSDEGKQAAFFQLQCREPKA